MIAVAEERSASWTIALAAAWLAAVAWVAVRLNQGWVPHDEGTLAHSAQRVLDGQLPHREFIEVYSGGLTFMNAGMFWLFDENLIWLRVPLFLLFIAFVPCFYLVARRFVGRPAALLVTAFAVAWSVPVYPAAMPSWYLLFLSVFGTYFTIRFFEGGSRWWLFAAGLSGGLAVGIKIVGVWFVVAVLVALTASEQVTDRRAGPNRRRIDGYRAVLLAETLLVIALVLSVVGSHLGRAEIVTLLIPIVALCCLPVVLVPSLGGAPAWPRITSLGRRIGPFLLGVTTPLVVLALPYVVGRAIPDLYEGVLVAPRTRLDVAYLSVPGLTALCWGVPVVAAMIVRHYVPRARWVIDALASAVLLVLLVTVDQARSYLALWDVARALGPFILVGGALLLAIRPGLASQPTQRLSLFLVLLVAGMGSLIQFPFAAAVYFFFVAPLYALAAVAIVGTTKVGGRVLPAALLVGLTLFGFVALDRQSIYTLGLGFRRDAQTVILDSARASIRVTPADRLEYRRAMSLLESYAAGDFTFAGPDAPELYFLARRKNPTRSVIDFLDSSDSARGDNLIRALREHDVTAVAINLDPGLSGPLEPATIARLAVLYPQHARAGKFDVRWRTPR